MSRLIINFLIPTRHKQIKIWSKEFSSLLSNGVFEDFIQCRPLVKECVTEKNIFLILNRNACCGYQKNRLNEMVLLCTKNIMLKLMGKKILTILH